MNNKCVNNSNNIKSVLLLILLIIKNTLNKMHFLKKLFNYVKYIIAYIHLLLISIVTKYN